MADPQQLEDFRASLMAEAAGLGLIQPTPLQAVQQAGSQNVSNLLAKSVLPEMRPPLAWEREAQKYQGEVSNLPERPNDYMAPVAELVSPTLGGYGMGQLAGGAYEAAGEGDAAGFAENAVPLMAMAFMPGAKAKPKGIRAYHGSPHEFEKFDAAKIGSGEGAQAYGHGLYFAEKEGVARSYRDAWQHSGLTPEGAAWDALSSFDGDSGRAIAAIRESIANPRPGIRTPRETYEKAIDLIEGGYDYRNFWKSNPGRMYEVKINAEPEQFLDWDKPLSGQSEGVKAALGDFDARVRKVGRSGKRYEVAKGDTIVDVFERDGSWTVTGPGAIDGTSFVHQTIGGIATLNDALTYAKELQGWHAAKSLAKDEVTSRALAEKGIAGIRYLDQGSRGKGEGSSNYVVFPGNEQLISIVKKYGIVGAASLLGMSQADVAKAMEGQE